MADADFSEQDTIFMDQVLEEARLAFFHGGAAVAALLALPEKVVAVARNEIQETGDLTSHAEMVLLRKTGRQLIEMDEQTRHRLSLYVTLEPCLMCAAALSFVGIKRIVYAALAEDANIEQMIARDLTLPEINPRLVRGPFTLVAGVRRAEGRVLLRAMNKASGNSGDLKK